MKGRILSKRFFQGIFWSYLAALLVFTIIPSQTGPARSLNHHYLLMIRWDYLLHAIAYLPLPALIYFSYGNGFKTISRLNRQAWVIGLTLAFSIAAGFELLQLVIPYRSFNINDLTGNVGGVIAGSVLLLVFSGRRSSPVFFG